MLIITLPDGYSLMSIHRQDCGQPIDMEERPAKRPRRVFLDAVEVPTVESVYGKPVKRFVHNASIEEMNAKIKSFKNVSLSVIEYYVQC